MAFETGYREGSFNGAAFFTSQTSDAFGRRGVHHEFPYKDKGMWDDLGAKDAQYQLELYVTNESSGGFAGARDALKSALEAGEGELVHPWLGRHKVVCIDFTVAHSEEELGVARFSATFIEAESTAKKPEVNPVAGLLGSASAALDKLASFAASGFSLDGVLSFVTDVTGGALSGLVGMVQNGVAFVDKAVSTLAPFVDIAMKAYNLVGVVTGLNFSLGGFLKDRLSLVTSKFDSMLPRDLTREIVGIISLSGPAAGGVTSAYDFLSSLSDSAEGMTAWASPPMAATATSVERINQNLTALGVLFQGAAAIESIKLIPYLEFDHLGQATQVKEDILRRFNDLAGKVDYDLYRDLMAISAAAMEIISLKAPNLARLGHRTLKTNLPSVVVAYDIYGDIDKEPDLVARNNIIHPGWLPAGVPLEHLIGAGK
jgi:prophage DNA circulation protein